MEQSNVGYVAANVHGQYANVRDIATPTGATPLVTWHDDLDQASVLCPAHRALYIKNAERRKLLGPVIWIDAVEERKVRLLPGTAPYGEIQERGEK